MNELNDLSDLIETLKARAERLRDLQASIDIFENPYLINASRNLERLDTELASRLHQAEQDALAFLLRD
jgi:hypothetical protein